MQYSQNMDKKQEKPCEKVESFQFSNQKRNLINMESCLHFSETDVMLRGKKMKL